MVKALIVAGVLVLSVLSLAGRASAAGSPFSCSPNYYEVIDGQLTNLNPVTGQYDNIGSAQSFNYNAIGYDTLNNYLYGIVFNGPQVGDLIQISSDGSTTDLGLPSGLPRTNYVSGDFDLNGNLYLYGNSTTIYKVNINSMTTTTLTIGGDPMVAADDNVYINNNLYMLDGDSMSIVNLNNNTSSTVTVSGPAGWINSTVFGAGWGSQLQGLFFSNNVSGAIYQIMNYDSGSPTASLVLNGASATNIDGANCPYAAQPPFDGPTAANYSYTTTKGITLNETTSLLSNDTGDTITITSNSTPSHGTVSINSDGTFTYTPNSNFIGKDSFTYTITDTFGRTATGTVTITVLPSVPGTGFGTTKNDLELQILTLSSIISLSLGIYGYKFTGKVKYSAR